MKATRQGARLDPFVEYYAARTQGLRMPATQTLFAMANRPKIMSLAGGISNIRDLPLDKISDHIAWMVYGQGTQVMQRGSGRGEPCIHEQIREVMAEENSVTDPSNIVITTGSQQGLDLVTHVSYSPGDVILAESPSYVGTPGTLRSCQTEMAHTACDSEGLIPEALIETTEYLKKQGRHVKFLYTIPDFSNLSGVTQPMERRHRVAESCAEAEVLMVGSDPCGLPVLNSDPLPTMRSLDTNVVYLGLFPKAFAPGFHVDRVCAPYGVREHLMLARKPATLYPPVFSQFAISNYLENYNWRDQTGVFRNTYRTRCNIMLAILEREVPDGCSQTRPAGGLFIWMMLPEGLNASTMLSRGVGARVAFMPGPTFFAGEQGSRSVQLSYYFSPPDQITTRVGRFAQVLRSRLEMLRTFGMYTLLHVDPTKGPRPNLD